MMKICFILDHGLKDYRVPLFEKLIGQGYDITIHHPGPVNKNFEKERQFISQRVRFGPVEYRKHKNIGTFDIVVFMQNLRIINLWIETLNPFRKFKIIHWGIGVSSTKGLSPKKNLISRLRNLLSCFSDAIILYSEFPIKLFSKKNQEKLYVAHNTIENERKINTSGENKDSFLFIGTLSKRKGLDELLYSFSNYLNSVGPLRIKKLVIIGDGPLKEELKIKVKELNLEEHVLFCGKITDLEMKSKYFSRAIATISPLQAGLSVLESFSFGVPFITFKNAISGGEHLNIKNDLNGFLVESVEELTDRLFYLNNHPSKALEMGNNAFNHYYNERKIEDMALKFVEAIDYSVQN